jgi:hypothetical protein
MGKMVKSKIDTKAIKNITNFIVRNPRVKVGVLGGTDDNEVLEYGVKHEFGDPTNNIPQRSFLRTTMNNYKDEFGTKIANGREKIYGEIMRGDYLTFLSRCGEQWKNYVKATFAAEGPNWKPLQPSTLAARKSNW